MQHLDESWLVACLCADWCGTCREYRATFEAGAREHPSARFVWVDIEDHADALGDLDIENFPTLLIARGDEPRFLGTLLPHAATLTRTLEAAAEAPLAVAEEVSDIGTLISAVRGVGERVR
jgi:thiol-disulfide isomerase/thioredoxin